VSAHIPRPGELYLDHVSHFVADLGAAARALRALGFAVTPESAQHTQDGLAGTSNVCVMLERGYLEFLAPTAHTPNAARVRAAIERYPGVHLACFGTPAAEEEHARLAAHGFAPQPLVALERETETGRARFKVVRPAPQAMPEGRVQFVEHLTPEVIWHARWMGHANEVSALACAFVVADDAIEAAARWAEFAALLPRAARQLVHLPADRGHVLIGKRPDWQALLGDAVPPAPALAGCALECRDPEALAARAQRVGCAVRRLRRALYAVTLPAALGGAWVIGTRESLAMDD
jgi:hypothetical protein